MNRVLLIDDDQVFKDTFLMEIQPYDIRLIHGRSFESLQNLMGEYHNDICSVVLDVKCLIKENQPKEDEGFIGTALTYLDMNYPGFPRVVLTGDDDAFLHVNRYNPNEDVFQKTPEGIKSVILKLVYYNDNSRILKIKRQNVDVFKLFEDNYYDKSSEQQVIDLFNCIDENDYSKFGGIFRNIRALQETIYKIVNQKNKQVVPDSLFKTNGMIIFSQLMKHLNGHPDRNFKPTRDVYQDQAISNMASALYWTCGSCIHADPNRIYYVSNYTIKSMVYSLMELFVWSKQYLA